MYLRAIELQGFKSFPDKVKLNFGRGMTAVVGPNGSGKSNLSDAVRWVLGEQSTKTLRGAKMEDVIFSGTKHRRPTGFAQVSLHIDNSDRALPVENDLCTVTRKLYRSGESDYLINGEPVRLKDVRELFMDTGLGRDGYSVIGQGKIAEIVSARDTERREIFEEAAGISKFRYRKEEALRRLEAAQENLNRLQDILGELESRVDPLREQARKANRYLELEREKRGVEISLWLTRFEGFAGQLRQLDHQFTLGRQEYQQAQQELQQLQNQMEQAFAQASQCAVHIQEHQARQAALEGELGENTSRQAVCRANMEHNRKALEELEQSLSQQQDAARKLEEQRDILRRQFLQRESREAQAQAQVQAAQAGLVDLRRQGEELAQALARAQEDYRAGVQQIADEKLGPPPPSPPWRSGMPASRPWNRSWNTGGW